MNNQINSKNTPKTYDAGDLHDTYALVYENTSWLYTLLGQIKKEVEEVKQSVAKKDVYPAAFANLERLINLSEYLAESHTDSYDVDRERYLKEWEANKKAVSL
ncbi:hypothetical protein [Acinetobacter sp. ANC 4973]|uniref:hypothetical protein n=1 Tax=Acinetobacter sp. ANC 4973 TaxID=1977871 RepID=UPI000A35041A|nr:hypothetical protein [Acinetobacter sp. ANC 4973]OTG98938.1 hypothetical protein B9T30_11485 [Acinetobacter sp. ANC 4973]